MNCQMVEELLAAYALNALSPEEESQVEAHLDECPWCIVLVGEYRQVAAGLSRSAEPLNPSMELKGRVLEVVEALSKKGELQRTRRFRGLFPLRRVVYVVAVLLVLLLASLLTITVRMSSTVRQLQTEKDVLSRQIIRLSEEEQSLVAAVRQQRSISYMVALPGTRVILLQKRLADSKGHGMLFLAPEDTVGVMVTGGLGRLPNDKTYQVWLSKEGQGLSVGLLSADDTGWGTIWIRPEEPITEFEYIAITVESKEGATEPSGELVLWAEISPKGRFE